MPNIDTGGHGTDTSVLPSGYKVQKIYVWDTQVRPSWPKERPDLDRYSLLESVNLWVNGLHWIAISQDWTKLYTWPAYWHIRQYTLTWGVLSGISWVESETWINVYSRWLYIKSNWDMLYSVSDNARWYNITLPTAYSLSWYSYVLINIPWIVQNNNPCGVRFAPEWDYFYTCRNQNIHKVKLNTAWDIGSYTSTWSTSVTLSEPSYVYNVAISPSWLKMFAWWENSIYQYNLSTARDITTATYSQKSLAITWRATFSVTEDWDIFQTETNGSNGNVHQYRAS